MATKNVQSRARRSRTVTSPQEPVEKIGNAVDRWPKRRGPMSRVPSTRPLQIALLGHYLILQNSLEALRKEYQAKARGWDPRNARQRRVVEGTLLDLQALHGFVSLEAVRRAAIPRRPQLARAAMFELTALYGWGKPRSSRATSSEPAGTVNAQLRCARQLIYSVRLDPFLVERARCGDRAAQRRVRELFDRIPREEYKEFQPGLLAYSLKYRRRPPA